MALLARHARTRMTQVLNEEFITVARVKRAAAISF
jgi:ABC-type dipeptide/oligopeptide/nickel transport system permease component